MEGIARLTDVEIKVMRVLWEHEDSLTIQQIAACLEDDGLSVQSVTQVIKHLLDKKAVTVYEHVLSGNVYARAFRPCYDQEMFLAAEFERLQKDVFGKKKRNLVGIVASLLSNSDDEPFKPEEIEQLQQLIDKKRSNS